jgi:hypothetical protein
MRDKLQDLLAQLLFHGMAAAIDGEIERTEREATPASVFSIACSITASRFASTARRYAARGLRHLSDPHQTIPLVKAARPSSGQRQCRTRRQSRGAYGDKIMSPPSTRSLPTIPFAIPAYWTPEQALAVVELLEDLRDLIWSHYAAQLLGEYRELYREPSEQPDSLGARGTFRRS